MYDKAAQEGTGVTYVDRAPARRFEQPAEMVVLCAYVVHQYALMLLAGIGEPYDPATGKGAVGSNYCYQTTSACRCSSRTSTSIPSWAAAPLGTTIDDFNSDNFDHSGLGFLGGAYHQRQHDQRAADRYAPAAAGDAALGHEVEGGECEVVLPAVPRSAATDPAIPTAITTSTWIRTTAMPGAGRWCA